MHRRVGALAGVAVVAVCAAWFAFAPRALGGPVTWIITDGTSMQPHLDDGDLVLVRPFAAYAAGDVVAYRSRHLDQIVLHRVADIDGNRFVMKGDNNAWLDSERPARADLVGKEFVVIGGGGKALEWLREPRRASAAAAAAAFSGLGGVAALRRRPRRRRLPAAVEPLYERAVAGRERALLTGSAVAFVALVAAALAGLARPAPAFGTPYGYEHQGRFSYSADARPGPVYGRGAVRTGQPVFLELVDSVEFSFDYSLTSQAFARVGGEARMFAEVTDPDGLTHTFPMAPFEPFEGTAAVVTGKLRLDEVVRRVRSVAAATGVHHELYPVTVVAEVRTEGTVATTPVEDSFSARLPMQLDLLRLKVPAAADGAKADPYAASQPGSVDAASAVAPGAVPFGSALAAAGALVALALAAVVIGFEPLTVPVTAEEARRIAGRYGGWLVQVRSLPPDHDRTVEVAAFEDLARVAQGAEKTILHLSGSDGHRYCVEQDGLVYVYTIGRGGE